MLILTRRVGETLMIGDEVTVTDLGSRNGTAVNGQRLRAATEFARPMDCVCREPAGGEENVGKEAAAAGDAASATWVRWPMAFWASRLKRRMRRANSRTAASKIRCFVHASRFVIAAPRKQSFETYV